MSVYVDGLSDRKPSAWWRWGPSCHLLPASSSPVDLEELHRFAAGLGLRRVWFQGARTRHRRRGAGKRARGTVPHYDLTARLRERAVLHGAVELSDRATLAAHLERLRGAAPLAAPGALRASDGREVRQ